MRAAQLPWYLVQASVAQINISRGGVPKRPVPEAEVTPLGIAGDFCAHPHIHGGPLQALLLVTSEGIDELKEHGFPLFAGALGENVTTRGLDRRTVRKGQHWRIGQIVIEVTKLRAPCDTLSVYGRGIQQAVYDPQVQAGDPSSPRWGLGGFYASVIQPGVIRPGDPIVLLVERA
jgi:MOSC domain-containing protein YiiM